MNDLSISSIALHYIVLILAGILLGNSATADPKTEPDVTEIGARFDCLHNSTGSKGATQGCIKLSGLRITHLTGVAQDASLRLTIDPFGRPAKSLAERAESGDDHYPSILDSSLHMITDLRLTWQMRKRLLLGLVTYGGATSLPNIHKLSLGSRFQYAGWNQAALSSLWTLGPQGDTMIELAIGNGEGEPTRNLDPQQFGALRVKHQIRTGLYAVLAGSFDGNNYGSEASEWVYANDQNEIIAGFSTQRLALALVLDGNLPALPGLKASIGYQQTLAKDLDKLITSIDTSVYANNPRLSLDELYVEDPSNENANEVETTVFDLGFSYDIMATHFISLNYETRNITTGSVDFFEDDKGAKHRRIRQSGYTGGLGLEIFENLRASLEYHSESYNKVFNRFSYRGPGGKKVKTLDLFNVRIMYNW